MFKRATVSLGVLAIACGQLGCANMTPRQKTWVAVGVGVIAAGAVLTYREHNGSDPAPQPATNCPLVNLNGVTFRQCP